MVQKGSLFKYFKRVSSSDKEKFKVIEGDEDRNSWHQYLDIIY